MLHVANRLLSSSNAPENADRARTFYQHFYRESAKFYGNEFLSLNIHALDHLADDVENSGCDLDEISAWPFENHLYNFKMAITNPNRVLAQYCRRLHSEMEIIDHIPKVPLTTEVLEEKADGSIQKYKYCNQVFTPKHPNNTAYLRSCHALRVVKIKNIFRENDDVFASVLRYKVVNSAFEFGAEEGRDLAFDSRSMNYVEVRKINGTENQTIKFSQNQKKMMKFSINFSPNLPLRTFVVPLLH